MKSKIRKLRVIPMSRLERHFERAATRSLAVDRQGRLRVVNEGSQWTDGAFVSSEDPIVSDWFESVTWVADSV